MIKDNIKKAKNYFELPERVKLGLKYLADTNLKAIENGKHKILGDDIYVNIQEYTSKPILEGKFEAHKNYIDIQYIIEGEERIGIGNIENFSPETEYNKEKDIVFLKRNKEGTSDFINLKANEFAIFTTEDAHMPSIATESPSYVKKAVVKVSV